MLLLFPECSLYVEMKKRGEDSTEAVIAARTQQKQNQGRELVLNNDLMEELDGPSLLTESPFPTQCAKRKSQQIIEVMHGIVPTVPFAVYNLQHLLL